MELNTLKEILNLGVAGLFFVMFWIERKDRIAAGVRLEETRPRLKTIEEMFGMLMTVVSDNTRALEALGSKLGIPVTRPASPPASREV